MTFEKNSSLVAMRSQVAQLKVMYASEMVPANWRGGWRYAAKECGEALLFILIHGETWPHRWFVSSLDILGNVSTI